MNQLLLRGEGGVVLFFILMDISIIYDYINNGFLYLNDTIVTFTLIFNKNN